MEILCISLTLVCAKIVVTATYYNTAVSWYLCLLGFRQEILFFFFFCQTHLSLTSNSFYFLGKVQVNDNDKENCQWHCCEIYSFFYRANRNISLALLLFECCSQWLMVKWLIVSHSSQIGQCIEKLTIITF